MTGRRPTLADIERGAVFTYYGPRRGLLRRRGVAAGVVVALDAAIGVVHVRTMRPHGDGVVTDIGHLPMVLSAFLASLHSIADKADWIDVAVPDVAEWRKRHETGDVGAFSCPLWEAERLAWDTLPRAEAALERDRLYIAHAYPRRGADGTYATVEVAVHRH